MPIKCVNDALELLKKNGKNPKGKKIAILGLGFRGEVTDTRLSPTFEVIKQFLKYNCHVHVHDPYVKSDKLLPNSVSLSDKLTEVVKDADLIFVSTDHQRYKKLNKKSFKKTNKHLLIFDGRNILNRDLLKNSSLVTLGIPK